MGLLNRNFTRDWQHLRECGSGYDLSRATGGESAIRCWRLKCCPIDLRQTWFRSSTIIQQIELYVALCGTTFPKNFTTAVCCQQALPNLRLNPSSIQPDRLHCLSSGRVSLKHDYKESIRLYAIAGQRPIKLARKSLWS